MKEIYLTKPENFDKTKYDRQVELVLNWKDNGGKGTVLAVTGFGKTYVLLIAADRTVQALQEDLDYPVITVVVPSIKLKDDWEEHLAPFPVAVRVMTVQELVQSYKNKTIKTHLLLIDEIHHFAAPEFQKTFEIVDYSFIFGSTATLDDDPKYDLLSEYCPVIGEVPLEEALENSWISDFTIWNLGFQITDQQKREYERMNEEFYKYFPTFDNNYGDMIRCLTDKKFLARYASMLRWPKKAVVAHAAQANRIINKRKRFLYNLPQKKELAKQVIQRFSGRTFITFSLTTDFAEELAGELGDSAVAYYSNMPTQIHIKETNELVAGSVQTDDGIRYVPLGTTEKLTWKGIKSRFHPKKLTRKGAKRRRKESLKLFEDPDNDVRTISTAKALDEGFNVRGINASVVTSRHGKSLQSLQRLGRMLRFKTGKEAFQVEIYAKNTQDEVWLRKAQQKSININYISHIDDISV